MDPGDGVYALLGPHEEVDGGDFRAGTEQFFHKDLPHEAGRSCDEHGAAGVELTDTGKAGHLERLSYEAGKRRESRCHLGKYMVANTRCCSIACALL